MKEDTLEAAQERARRMHRRAQRAYSQGRRDCEREYFDAMRRTFVYRIAQMLGVKDTGGSWFDYEARVLERVSLLASVEDPLLEDIESDDNGK